MYNSQESQQSNNKQNSSFRYTPQKNQCNRQRFGSIISTETNTPDNSEFGDLENFSLMENSLNTQKNNQQSFEIDVQPKKKSFQSFEEKKKYVQEYTKKMKTEMCKNWVAVGSCKFQDKCSFAHGNDELKDKQHLHNNYKTKPCKKFFVNGYCSYGNRCQYLHSDLYQVQDQSQFIEKIHSEKQLYLPNLKSYNNYAQRWQQIEIFLESQNSFYEKNSLLLNIKPRLPIFVEICQNNNNLEEILYEYENNMDYSIDQDIKNIEQWFFYDEFQQNFDTFESELKKKNSQESNNSKMSNNSQLSTKSLKCESPEYIPNYNNSNLIKNDIIKENQQEQKLKLQQNDYVLMNKNNNKKKCLKISSSQYLPEKQ